MMCIFKYKIIEFKKKQNNLLQNKPTIKMHSKAVGKMYIQVEAKENILIFY